MKKYLLIVANSIDMEYDTYLFDTHAEAVDKAEELYNDLIKSIEKKDLLEEDNDNWTFYDGWYIVYKYKPNKNYTTVIEKANIREINLN